MGGWGGGRKERLIFRCEKAGRPPPPHGVVVWGRSAVRPCSGPAEISCPNLKSAADRRHQRGRTARPRQRVRTGGRTEGPFLSRGWSLDGVPPHLGLPVAPQVPAPVHVGRPVSGPMHGGSHGRSTGHQPAEWAPRAAALAGRAEWASKALGARWPCPRGPGLLQDTRLRLVPWRLQ